MCIRDSFWFDGVEEVVTSGHMVLYQPKEIQKYVYYVEAVSYTHLDVYKRQVVFFSNQPKIARKLQTLLDVGLGYVDVYKRQHQGPAPWLH